MNSLDDNIIMKLYSAQSKNDCLVTFASQTQDNINIVVFWQGRRVDFGNFYCDEGVAFLLKEWKPNALGNACSDVVSTEITRRTSCADRRDA